MSEIAQQGFPGAEIGIDQVVPAERDIAAAFPHQRFEPAGAFGAALQEFACHRHAFDVEAIVWMTFAQRHIVLDVIFLNGRIRQEGPALVENGAFKLSPPGKVKVVAQKEK